MDFKHRKLIKEKSQLLVQSINFKVITPFIKREKIFTSEMFEDINNEADDNYRNQKFLEELQSRGPEAFNKFICALQDAGQNEALKCLDLATNTSLKVEDELYNENNYNHNSKSYEPKWPSDAYKMDSFPRGLCIIINNVDFKMKNDYRYGSDEDAIYLDTTFSKLGYKVYLKRNLTALEMKNALYDFSKLAEFKNVDSCIVILLSHGLNGYIDGVDCDPVSMFEILMLFDNENCKNLIGKPKLFFVQACSDNIGDKRITISLSSDASGIIPLENGTLNKNVIIQDRIPILTDVLISFSAVKGHTSDENRKSGTWYCQALCKCLKEHSLTKDLSIILHRVEAEIQGHMKTDKTRGMQVETTGFLKDFYFNVPENNKKYFLSA